MSVLVAYATRLGSTAGIADAIAARLNGRGLRATARPVEAVDDLTPYDAFVVGSAVYAGRWLDAATDFVRDHRADLSGRPVWLFSSGPVGKTATKNRPVEPAEVTALATATLASDHHVFAGALDRGTVDGSGLGFGERFIAKRFVPEGDYRDWSEIAAWADEIATSLMRAHALRT